MGDSSISMLANRKLSRVNETVINFKNRLAKIFDKKREDNSSIDSLRLLRELQKNASDIESLTKKLIDLKESLIDQTNYIKNDTKNCSHSIYHIHTAIFNTKERLIKEVAWVKSLATTLIPAKIVNEESIVQKGQILIEQIKQIDLKGSLKSVYEHLNASDELSERVLKYQEPWLKIQKEIGELKKRIKHFNDLINDSNRWIAEAGDKTVRLEQNYVGLTNTYKEILLFNKKLNDLNGTIDNLLQKAKEQNEKSKKVLNDELDNLNVDKQYEELLIKFDKMQEQRNQLSEEMEKLQKLVVNALTNVDNVAINATKVVNSFKDTKSYSQDSVKAANSFLSIKETIDNSLNFINNAEDLISETNTLLNIGNKTKLSKADSYNLKTTAMNNQVKINNEIGVKLNATKNRLNDLNHKLNEYLNSQKNIRDHITDLQNSKLKQTSDTVISLSDKAISFSDSYKAKLNEKEKALLDELYSQTSEFDSKVKNGSSALRGILVFHRAIDSTLPTLLTEIEKTPAKLDRINKTQSQLDQSLSSIKKQVKTARAIANRIDLGLEIKPNTYVELRAHPSQLIPGTYTKLSLYFRPFVANGLIAYLGNPKSIKSTAQSDQYQKPLLNDYLALELRERRVALIMDVGSEAMVVLHDTQVQLNEWYYIEVEVIGKHVQLKLRSTSDQIDKILTSHLQGTFTVFNLDRLNSKLYLGGIPKNIELQDKIENVDFDGEIQQVTLGETKLGLWNFVNGKNNNRGIYKKEAAFKNLNNLSENSAVKFNGKAYAQLDGTGFDLRRETDLFMQFKTLSSEGLLFLVIGELKYLSVELEQGKLVVKIDLDSGKALIRSKESVNDGNWHLLQVSRFEKEIIVKLDSKEIDSKDTGGRDVYLETDGQFYFGGYPNGHLFEDRVTKIGFNGCLRNIQIGTRLVKLDKDDRNISPGVEFGCSENVVRELSFEKRGFITMPSKMNEINQISLKFRTKDANGLLFFASNRNMSEFLAIYLNNSALVFKSQPGETISSSRNTERQFNDNLWHYLTATRTRNIMRLDLDDKFVYQPSTQQQVVYSSLNLDDNSIYFGGVDKDKTETLDGLDLPTSFIGCLGDVNLNEDLENFALSKRKMNVLLVSCLKENNEIDSEEPISIAPDSTQSPDDNLDIDPRMKPIMTTTTTEEPDIPGKKKRPIRGCKLPVRPNEEKYATLNGGLKYGEKMTSRTETKLEESKIKEIEKETRIDFKFNSLASSGLLVLLADNKLIDHTMIYLNDNKLYCSFNLGSGQLLMNSENELTQNEWHRVSIVREAKNVTITIDDKKEIINDMLTGDKTSLNVNPVLYVGGLSNELIEQVSGKLKISYSQFNGCINDLKLNSDLYLLDLEDSYDDVKLCDSNPVTNEEGVFFKGIFF